MSRTRDILGSPVAPPPAMTRVGLTARRVLGRAFRSGAPPTIRVMEGLFGLIDNRMLGLLVELDVPEHLTQRRTIEELARLTGTSTDELGRVVRYAAGRGFLRLDRRGRVKANGVTRVLRRDHPNSWRGWVEFGSSDWFWDAFRHIDAPVRGQGGAMEAAHGAPFFDHLARTPEAADAFNRAMAGGAVVQAFALSRGLDWRAVRTVCDVGGGTGAGLRLLLDDHPHLRGTLFELPEVAAAAEPGDRCELAAGSFFEADSIPAGRDRYLLLAIVHDWDDESVVRILHNVARAGGPSSEIVVVEGVLADRPQDDFVQASDMLMLALATGRERTATEFEAVFSRAGLVVEEQVALLTGFSAFVLRAGAGSAGR